MKNKKTFLTTTGVMMGVLGLTIMIPTGASAALTTTLQLGARSADVTELQTFLAKDNTIYPQGLVTGYFGSLTKSAVSNFQARNNLGRDGIVGPLTRAMINQQMGGGTTNTSQAPAIQTAGVSASRNSASVNWNTNLSSKGVVYYSPTPLSVYEYENSVDVSGMTAMTDTNYRTSQSVGLSNLQANTLYHYLVYVTGQNGLVSVTWPSTFMTTN